MPMCYVCSEVNFCNWLHVVYENRTCICIVQSLYIVSKASYLLKHKITFYIFFLQFSSGPLFPATFCLILCQLQSVMRVKTFFCHWAFALTFPFVLLAVGSLTCENYSLYGLCFPLLAVSVHSNALSSIYKRHKLLLPLRYRGASHFQSSSVEILCGTGLC